MAFGGCGAAASGPANPLAGATLFVELDSNARRQAELWREDRPADAALMDVLAGLSQATWFGDWNTDLRADVDVIVAAAVAQGAMAVLVAEV